MAYSLVDFAKSLRVDRCKIENTPNFVFLCGGPTTIGASCRSFFNQYLLSKKPAWTERVKLAEDVNSWFNKDNAFPDLLELENYLAHLADVIVLFVESPGSIAELGAFAASDVLRPKLLAVRNTFYDSKRSFIADGPIRKIWNTSKESIQSYTWDPEQLDTPATKEEFGDVANRLTEILECREKRRPQQLAFKAKEIGHTLLLVADLIRIPGVASKSDVARCLKVLRCKKALASLDHHLSVLQSIDFIQKHHRSDRSFYVSHSSKPFIRYAYVDSSGVITDATRIQTMVRGNLDSIRRGVLRTFLQKESLKGKNRV